MSATLLVATETHFVRGSDGIVRSTTGVDGYDFWTRYLDVFDRVLVAARTRATDGEASGIPVDGPGVEVAALPDYVGPWEYLRVRPALAASMRAAVARADALCLRAPGPIAGLAWRARGARPYAVEVVGDPLDALAAGAVRSVARPVARLGLVRDLRAMCRQADAVAYVTSGELQRRYPTPGWSTEYSSIQLDDDAFVSEETARARYGERVAGRGTPNDPWRLIFVGSLAQMYKGPDVAIRALGLCRSRGMHATLTMVGDGAKRPALEQLARASGLAEAVRFLGQLPAGAPIRAALDAHDLFVLPSRTEGLPRAMIEAMARGVVCVGSRVGGMPQLLPSAQLVRPGDAEHFAMILSALIANELGVAAIRDRSTALDYRASVLSGRRVTCYRRLRRDPPESNRSVAVQNLGMAGG